MRRPSPRLDSMRAVAVAALACVAAGLTPSRAAAQLFAGTGSAGGVAMPGATDVPAVAVPPSAPTRTLRHVPSTFDGLKLVGETGDLVWPVYLTAAQAGSPLRFRIGYKSAVSILPETSRLVVRVNDREIGADAIDAPRETRIVEFAIPADIAREGFNAVEVSVQQRHRVDCSVTATYELWTRIDPVETGLVVIGEAPAVATLADLPAARSRPDGSLPIHVVVDGKVDTPHLQQLIRATGAVALAARTLAPAVDFDRESDEPYGVNLVVGTRAALAKNARAHGALGPSGPFATLLPDGPANRPTIVATGDSEAEVDAAIASLDVTPGLKGSSAGVVAARNYPGHGTEGGETLALRDLSVRSEEFSGRFFRRSFNLALPADFLASNYGRGTFDLAGGYAAGLQRGSQVRVDINGKSSGVIKLPYAAGDVFRHNQLFLPLGLMRPGLNRVEIYAETPRAADASCEASNAKRFLLLDSSKIELPTLARVQRLPDLAATTSGGLPFTEPGAWLVVPKPDRDVLGSALSLTARIAVGAGKVVPFAFATKMPSDATRSTLLVSPAQSLDPDVMSSIDLDPSKVEAAWRDVAPQALPATATQGRWWIASTEGPAACRVPSLAAGRHPVVSAPPPTIVGEKPAKAEGGDDLYEAWSEERHAGGGWLAVLKGLPTQAQRWVEAVPRAIHARFGPDPGSEAIVPEASVILAQGMSRGSRDAVTTIVTAPNSAMLRASMPCLFDPQVWSKIHGRLAVLDAADGKVTAVDATSFHYAAGSRVSLANTRLVLAGWFSLDPLSFTAFAMLLTLLLSGSTLWFVKGVGRTSE